MKRLFMVLFGLASLHAAATAAKAAGEEKTPPPEKTPVRRPAFGPKRWTSLFREAVRNASKSG